ncbi:hypothetical protein MUN76_09325 [Leucobacter rhizosphaerae]|uniref:Modulator of FtsH protease n=1 Tax=Leucobacter rhizosphaerae TaxID=2932245 RepID=A0ABY4FSL2_9MICO|nr:hypothetical protein [Leucobacter rhizosphaerae]UOQ59258.1 hypothetical protein MUN76_09325 [Leucobacter rhizosphaerae]
MDDVGAWSEFNVAMAGATAALAGLVIVAASVNIERIVRTATLTSRLAAAIAALLLALVASGTGLVPGVDPTIYGIVILVCTLAAAWFQVHATRVIFLDPEPAQHARAAKSVAGFLPILAYLAAGIALTAGHESGLVLAAAGCLIAIVAAVLISWIVLVEVLR